MAISPLCSNDDIDIDDIEDDIDIDIDDIEDMESMRRAITWLIMAISPLCSNSRETRGTSGENYIEKDCGGERGNAEI